jgi:hypothetical protein
VRWSTAVVILGFCEIKHYYFNTGEHLASKPLLSIESKQYTITLLEQWNGRERLGIVETGPHYTNYFKDSFLQTV